MYKSGISILISLACLINLFKPINALAQNGLNFTSITMKQGLSANTVNGILKDKYDLVWFATTDGLNRFDGTNFQVYRHESGNPYSLPSNDVLTFYEDHSGNFWIGTDGGGVCLYDRKFERFIPYTGDGSWPAIKTTSVRAITQDHRGWIWVATYNDLRMFNPHTGRIIQLPIKNFDPKYTPSLVVLSLLEDSRRRMWVGTNQGLYLYNWATRKFHSFTSNPSNPNSISNDVIKTIAEDPKGNIWFGTFAGLNEWVSFNHFRSFQHLQNQSSVSSNTIFSIADDGNGNLLIGTEDGLDIYNPADGTFKKISSDPRNVFSLKGKSIRALLVDKQGIYWIGTFSQGINIYDKRLPLFSLEQSNPFDPFGLRSPVVDAFAKDDQGKIFIGTDGGGLEVFNKTTGLFTPLPLKSKLKNEKSVPTILSLYYSSRKQLWAGTYHDGLFRIDPATGNYEQFISGSKVTQLSNNDITAIQEDHEGNIWIGTLGGGVDVYNPATHRFKVFSNAGEVVPHSNQMPLNNYIGAIACAPDGEMWIGSVGTGLAVYHPSTASFTHYTKAANRLTTDDIQSIFFARDGCAWIGTSQGISRFNAQSRRFISYNERSGLANEDVKAIVEDDSGLIWFSTDKSISNFDPRKKTIKNFTCENGVQQGSFSTGAALKSDDGNLFFGGQDGFNFFNPRQVLAVPPPGPILFTDLKVDNVTVKPGKNSPLQEQIGVSNEIKLKFGQNFSISYVALNYTSPKQNLYKYRLVGFDKNWNDVHDSRTASYTNLDPGRYLFEVRVSNNNSVWKNPVKKINVIVAPPFWRTTIAYVLYAVITVVILLLMRRRAVKNIRRKFEAEQQKLQAKQMIEQERREAEQLHKLDNLKIKFLTDLSHEFRTPISLIAAPVEKLLSKDLGSDVREHLLMMNRNVKRLLNLVSQLLDFRKMEEQELRVNLSPGDVIAFILETAESFRDLSVIKGINLEIHHTINNRPAFFDHDKLERIIFNLLSNAFKFTPAGGTVTLDADIFEDEKLKTILVLTITDTGVGIENQYLDKIFERFYQPERSDPILNQGTGIGLTITKEFVELQHGRIWAESKIGAGAKFFVEIPLVADAGHKNPETCTPSGLQLPATEKGADGGKKDTAKMPETKPNILLVEDNDEFRRYLADHLAECYQVVEATNGKEGWQRVLSSHPQLVVSDVSMPYMDGIELSKKIKADKRTCQVPVILLTAHTDEEQQLKGLKSGASDFLPKPFSFQILNTKIENLLALKRSLKETYSKQIHFVEQQITTESADVRLLDSARKYIENKMSHSDVSVEDLSKHVGISRASLYHKMIQLTGLTPVEYIRTAKLEKAAILLESGEYNIAQVAYMTGFATPSYFSKIFKNKFGVMPSEYLHMKVSRVEE